jgi:hypothetical protein
LRSDLPQFRCLQRTVNLSATNWRRSFVRRITKGRPFFSPFDWNNRISRAATANGRQFRAISDKIKHARCATVDLRLRGTRGQTFPRLRRYQLR